jgi:O-antigen/teichoic acid export membrane protein
VLREVWHNGQSLLAFFVLTNLDVLMARNQFPHVTAGVYAAGSIIAKTCLFLPQFVIIVAFPKMAQDAAEDSNDRTWLRPLGLVALLGLCAVLGAAVLNSLAVTFVGGDKYHSLSGYAWLFALEGTAYALLQMVVYRQIARQAKVAVYLWAGAAAVVLAGLLVNGNQPLVVAVVLIVAAVTVPVTLARPARPLVVTPS